MAVHGWAEEVHSLARFALASTSAVCPCADRSLTRGDWDPAPSPSPHSVELSATCRISTRMGPLLPNYVSGDPPSVNQEKNERVSEKDIK